jgi:diguanylate cyclase (GGDEF)-like protein
MEGDKALCIVADAMKNTADAYGGFASRMGGDEFLLSVAYANEDIPHQVKVMLDQKIQEKCKQQQLPYVIKISIGHMICNHPNISLLDLLMKADEMQYKSKKQHHAGN